MKKNIYISCLLLVMSISVDAQLIVNWNKKVFIRIDMDEYMPLLAVGDNGFFEETDVSIGTGGAPEFMNTNNLGIHGRIVTNSNFSNDSNFGVIGKVSTLNGAHGRNYGLSGMIDDYDCNNPSGGAGVYATCYDYYFSHPTNIQGTYAAFFAGNVYASGNLTATSLFTTMDSRLCDNIVSLSQSKKSGMTTLENLLNMNVVEYNLKGRQFEEIPENTDPEKAEEVRKELEFLKKEDKEMTSRRHFGVDARELQKVYPGLVLEGQDGYLSVNYLEMVPLVIRSIQELKEEIDELK